MTTAVVERLDSLWGEPKTVRTFFTTVDHKRIGIRYCTTAFVFFLVGGVLALVMRAQLARPDETLVSPDTYDQLFSMHGTTMIFLFVTPMLSGFGNFFVPLLIGARDMAYPRLNAFGYWVFLAAGLFLYSSFLFGEAPSNGWFNYAPLSLEPFSSGRGVDFYALGLTFLGISTIAGGANFIVTIFKMRAPGMSINRLPLFCWAVLAISFSILVAVPALTAGNVLLELERRFGFHFFDPAHGGDPVLWQHLFWIFGHPDVYIIFLPAVGIVSSIVPTFARRPIVAYSWMAVSTVLTAVIGFGVWVHHMFAVGLPNLSMGFFAAASVLITIPSAVQVFGWIATLLRGRPVLRTPLLFVLGFIVLFVMGGVTGVMFAAVPFDQQVTDSYFVVAHFHYVLFGGAVFPIFAAIYYWAPKMTGRLLPERWGQLSFWLMFVGFNLAFFPMHISGLLGMPRRVWTYQGGLGWDTPNLLASIGSFVLAVGIGVTVLAFVASLMNGEPAGPDPWEGETLEWSVSSPPPPYNFAVVPTVRDLSPNWDLDARRLDEQRLARRDRTLADGHDALSTTVLDAEPARVLAMPEATLWPLLTTVALSLTFVALLIGWWWLAAVGLVAVFATLAGWHRTDVVVGVPG